MMDSQTIISSFNYTSPQPPIFSVLESSIRYRSFDKDSSSFSTYLKPNGPTPNPQEIRHQTRNHCPNDDTEISIFDAQKYFSESNDSIKDVKRPSNDHLQPVPRLSSVSSADGYGRNYRTRSFHATPTASSEASWNSQTGLLANPPGSMAVSLRNFPPDMHVKKRNSAAKKWGFGRKCCCTGKNSVQVKEVASDSDTRAPVGFTIKNEVNTNHEKPTLSYVRRDNNVRNEKTTLHMPQTISIPDADEKGKPAQKFIPPNPFVKLSPENGFASADPPRQQRLLPSGMSFGDGAGAGFSFPILNSSFQAAKPSFKTVMAGKAVINPLDDPPRESLEVFQPMHDAASIARPSDFNPGSPIARSANKDDDMYSDASSDLFEIESFSTQTTSCQMSRGRDSLDEALIFNPRRFTPVNGTGVNSHSLYGRRSVDEPPTPSVAATECYAPSEVSVDWSVTTAEGYDRASVTNFSISASEIGNVAFLRQRMQEESCNITGGGGGNENGKRKGNGLLLMSCRQEKAVSVGPQPVKCVAPEVPPLFPLNMTGNAASHVGGRPQSRANKPPLGGSHAARLSLAFAA